MLASVLAAIAIAGLVLYALTGGADFGGGAWVLLAGGSRGRAQRELIAKAVGPIWEAQHVWLIFVIVVLFVCFPPVYATVGTALHLPLVVMLIGIVLRGAAFAFRSHDYGPTQSGWDRVFAGASLLTPLMLGVCVGAVASGRIRADEHGYVSGGFIDPWMSPFPVAVGFFTLVEFAFLAASYLVMEARDDGLRVDFKWRAIASGALCTPLAFAVLLTMRSGAPLVWEGVIMRPWIVLGGGLLGLASVIAQGMDSPRFARGLAIGNVACVVLGWALAQFPWLVVPDLTIDSAQSSPIVLQYALGAIVAGTVLLVPALIWLYSTFKSEVR